MNAKKLTGLALATAAAGLFATAYIAPVLAAKHMAESKVQCKGVNSCKGQTSCKSATNACKGQNSCKGQGFLEMSKADCDAALAKLKQEKM